MALAVMHGEDAERFQLLCGLMSVEQDRQTFLELVRAMTRLLQKNERKLKKESIGERVKLRRRLAA